MLMSQLSFVTTSPILFNSPASVLLLPQSDEQKLRTGHDLKTSCEQVCPLSLLQQKVGESGQDFVYFNCNKNPFLHWNTNIAVQYPLRDEVGLLFGFERI